MNCWEILQTEITTSKSSIKRAYVKLIKVHSPESDPEEFARIREAYENALNLAKNHSLLGLQSKFKETSIDSDNKDENLNHETEVQQEINIKKEVTPENEINQQDYVINKKEEKILKDFFNSFWSLYDHPEDRWKQEKWVKVLQKPENLSLESEYSLRSHLLGGLRSEFCLPKSILIKAEEVFRLENLEYQQNQSKGYLTENWHSTPSASQPNDFSRTLRFASKWQFENLATLTCTTEELNRYFQSWKILHYNEKEKFTLDNIKKFIELYKKFLAKDIFTQKIILRRLFLLRDYIETLNFANKFIEEENLDAEDILYLAKAALEIENFDLCGTYLLNPLVLNSSIPMANTIRAHHAFSKGEIEYAYDLLEEDKFGDVQAVFLKDKISIALLDKLQNELLATTKKIEDNIGKIEFIDTRQIGWWKDKNNIKSNIEKIKKHYKQADLIKIELVAELLIYFSKQKILRAWEEQYWWFFIGNGSAKLMHMTSADWNPEYFTKIMHEAIEIMEENPIEIIKYSVTDYLYLYREQLSYVISNFGSELIQSSAKDYQYSYAFGKIINNHVNSEKDLSKNEKTYLLLIAKNLLLQAIKIKPASQAFAVLGDIELYLGNLEYSLKSYQKVDLYACPLRDEVRLNIFTIYFLQKKWVEAIEILEAAFIAESYTSKISQRIAVRMVVMERYFSEKIDWTFLREKIEYTDKDKVNSWGYKYFDTHKLFHKSYKVKRLDEAENLIEQLNNVILKFKANINEIKNLEWPDYIIACEKILELSKKFNLKISEEIQSIIDEELSDDWIPEYAIIIKSIYQKCQ